MEPRLYIIMREDLWDMNPGKGMAQAAHAQALFDAYTPYTLDGYGKHYSAWAEDRGFGVTLVLTAPKSEWIRISLGVDYYGYVNDPTYPYRNYYGKLFTSSEDTCMWVFATTEQEVEHMNQWPLQK